MKLHLVVELERDIPYEEFIVISVYRNIDGVYEGRNYGLDNEAKEVAVWQEEER